MLMSIRPPTTGTEVRPLVDEFEADGRTWIRREAGEKLFRVGPQFITEWIEREKLKERIEKMLDTCGRLFPRSCVDKDRLRQLCEDRDKSELAGYGRQGEVCALMLERHGVEVTDRQLNSWADGCDFFKGKLGRNHDGKVRTKPDPRRPSYKVYWIADADKAVRFLKASGPPVKEFTDKRGRWACSDLAAEESELSESTLHSHLKATRDWQEKW